MGLSIGMGDEYEWYLAWQWVDITGLPSGTYTVRAKADPYGFFEEEDEANQCAYAIVSFTTGSSSVSVLERGQQGSDDCVNDWSGSTFARAHRVDADDRDQHRLRAGPVLHAQRRHPR